MCIDGQVHFVPLVRLQTDNSVCFFVKKLINDKLPFARWANTKQRKENGLGFCLPFSVWYINSMSPSISMSSCLHVHVSVNPCLRESMSPCPCLRASLSPCLHFLCFHVLCLCLYVPMSSSPCLHVSMSPCLHVSMFPCFHVSMSPCPCRHVSRKRN